MAVEINPSSYLLFSTFVDINGVAFWDLPQFPELFPQDDDIFVTIGQGTLGTFISSDEPIRPDLLSHRIYGTPHLWWIIALRNNFELVPTQFKLNDRIVVPSPRYVFQEVLPKRV